MDPLTTPAHHGTLRPRYRMTVAWLFNLFGSIRILTYLPTIATIVASGDSNQHSLWTWGLWLGSHLTMAAWLVEEAAGRVNRAALVSLGNAAMCALTFGVIAAQRF